MKKGDLHDLLGDHRRYEHQIDRLHLRFLRTRRLYELQEGDVSLASVVLHRSRFARLLARTVARGRYQSGPARIRKILARGKERTVFSYQLTDFIVHGVVSEIISEAMAPFLSPRLYSYRKGVSWWSAVSELGSFLRSHRKRHPDPRERHMYVVRRDIEAYTNSIPVGEGAPLWSMLREVLSPPGGPAIAAEDWSLLARVVRPEVQLPKGGQVTLLRGVATGQPISCVLYNLYLSGMDRQLDRTPGAFYARYSDDIYVFAHPDPEVARGAAVEIERAVERLGLGMKAEKSLDIYLTGAGRASAAWPEAKGRSWVPFLGAFVGADGTVSLNTQKMRRLLSDVEDRTVRTARSLLDESPQSRGPIVCSIINRMFDRHAAPLYEGRSAALVRRAVTDRRQLAQLDYRIARIVLKAVTGDAGVRAFRRFPYRRIRQEWGLLSLEHARNTTAARKKAR